jgi:DNA invertase Pin-like site-specific DNA recombinase
VRVSSFEQNPQRQLEHVEAGRVFTDKASGKDTQRPELDSLLPFVREGDTVVVHSMDRLARSFDTAAAWPSAGLADLVKMIGH